MFSRPRSARTRGRLAIVVLALVAFGCTSEDIGLDSESTVATTSTPNDSGGAGGAGGAVDHGGRTTAVERIIDGDTIVVVGGERIRLIGIDTPETVKPGTPVECFGKEASRFLAELIPPGTSIELVSDVDATDRYDRTLSYIYRTSDGAFVNALLVSEGYAAAYTVPPNVAHADEFVALAAEARRAGKGLWSAC